MLSNLIRITSLMNHISKLKVRPFYMKNMYNKFQNCIGALGFCGTVYAQNNSSEDITIKFEKEARKATQEGEKYLSQLMCMLRMLILQASVEYQECLIKQIEITKKNTQIGPVGEHWDQLVGFRIKGKELKEELIKYEALASNIAELVHNETRATYSGNEVVLDQLNGELKKLQKLCNEQLQEIRRYETELLKASRDSILFDPN